MANRILLVVCAVLLGSLLFIGAKSTGSVPTRWEYKMVYDPSEAQLNQLGDQGWEVARGAHFEFKNSYAPEYRGRFVMVLQRPK